MPTHETQADRDAEANFAGFMAARNWSMYPLVQYYPFDFFASKGNVNCFIEYKKRTHAFGAFPTTYFPAQKFAKCRSWARELNIPFYIFIEWDDQTRFCNAMDVPFFVTIAGRNDRVDSYRYGPMVEMSLDAFKKICD